MRHTPRNALALLLGSALFTAACSHSNGGTSGTTGTTTGGTTTGSQALAAGAACSSNAACASGICGLDGTGNCCVGPTACVSGDPTCGATGCDDNGSCTYPSPSVTCGASSCQEGTFTPAGACNGQGTCHPSTSSTCPNSFGCAAVAVGSGGDGGVCATACTSSAECATDFVCNAHACVAKIVFGTCTENDDCSSGACGANGAGNCCAAACGDGGPPCGATGCDATSGACEYPADTVACGSVAASCTDGTQQNPSLCDGKGNCDSSPTTIACAPFTCSATACFTTCADDSSCGGGDFCDVTNATCCGGLTGDAGVISVDSVQGTDSVCCGIGAASPCATITRAMRLIDASQARNATILATVDGGGGDWGPSGEIYPIVLGWGAELDAPGVYFNDTSRRPEIFDIAHFSASDTVGAASILGTAASPVYVGIDSKLQTETEDASAIQVEAGNTAYLASATVNGNLGDLGDGTNAITVVGGASLVLGQDQSGAASGTVTIGGPKLLDGFNGIVCTSVKGAGCTITDAALAKGLSSVIIQNQEGVDIDAEDGASITLTSNPVIGVAPATVGFENCPSKDDSEDLNTEAVLLNGSATMTFKNGTVSCIAGSGFSLQGPPDGGAPSLTLDSSTIENTELGVYASAGTATITKTTIQYNYYGAEQDSAKATSGTINLGGGSNTVICSNSAESVLGNLAPGVCVLNTTDQTLDATNTTWDTAGPDLFHCNPALTTCTCQIGSCAADAGSDGMDAVYEATGDGGTIATTGNALSKADCTVPVEEGCGPGNVCPKGEQCCLPFGICIPPGQICPP